MRRAPKGAFLGIKEVGIIIVNSYEHMEQVIPHFRHSALNETQAKKLWAHLIDEQLIDSELTSDDFVYYICGIGDQPSHKINWKSSKILLSIYVYEIGDRNFRPEWCVAEKIINNITASSLRDNHSRPFSKDCSRSFDSFFENQKRVRSLIEEL